MDKDKAPSGVILFAAWALSLILVNPIGEYPLNDDWLYARTVETFLVEGKLIKPQLAAVSVVFQTLWGAGFASIFGFSHTVLRFSNLVLHLLGAFAVSAVVFRLTGKRTMSTLAGLTLLYSPLALLSACSFMWEPSLVAMLSFGILALLDWEQSHSVRAGVPLIFFCVMAVLVHPVALILPVWLLLRRPDGNGSSMHGIWPGALSLVVGLVFVVWYFRTGASDTMTGFWVARTVAIDTPFRVFVRLPGAIIYLGLFLLPVGCALFSVKRVLLPFMFLSWAWGQGLWVGGMSPLPLPCLENTLSSSGLGFVGLQGAPPLLGAPFWWFTSILAVISAFGILGRLKWSHSLPFWTAALLAFLPWAAKLLLGPSMLRAGLGGLVGLVAWVAWLWPTFRERGFLLLALGWLFVVILLPPFYDRYLVPLLPLLLIGLVRHAARVSPLVWIVAAVMTVGSVAGVHDYLAVNRTRWEVLNELTELRAVDPSMVDGGYEWAGWHYAWKGVANMEKVESATTPWWIRHWAPQIRPRYTVALSSLPGMSTLQKRTCSTWNNRWHIYLLRNKGSTTLLPR